MKPVEYISVVAGGTVFGFGLAYSGAAIPEVALSFLTLQDLGLVLVIGVALATTALVYNMTPKIMSHSVFGSPFTVKDSSVVVRRTIVGASIFGIGWGLTGLCPGTSFAAIGMGNMPVLYGVAGMFYGALIYGLIRSKQ